VPNSTFKFKNLDRILQENAKFNAIPIFTKIFKSLCYNYFATRYFFADGTSKNAQRN